MEAVDTDMFAVWNWTFENAAAALVRHDGVWFTTESITILPGETRDISDLMFMTTDRIPEWRVSDETKLTVSDTRLTALAARDVHFIRLVRRNGEFLDGCDTGHRYFRLRQSDIAYHG